MDWAGLPLAHRKIRRPRAGPQRPPVQVHQPRAVPALNEIPRRQQRIAAYKKAQDLYNKSRSALADKIFTGKPLIDKDVFPVIEDADAFFRGILESTSPSDDHPFFPKECADGAFVPIAREEIDEAKVNWSNSAPGPDGITIPKTRGCPTPLLKVLFNLVLYRQSAPPSWHLSQTVLVPKDGDRRLPSNWRPITISSALQRLFHRVLARRLSKFINLNHHQRGFVEEDGVLANAIIIDQYMTSRRASRKSYNVASK